jgi:2-aminomuconate deaminase
MSDKLPKPMGLYPIAKRAGNLLFLSGLGPREAGTDNIPGLETDKYGNYKSFDFEKQVHAVFKNVRTALEEAGSSWEQIVDVTIFLVDMKRDFQKLNHIYSDYFKTNMPTRTTVEVTALPSPIAIELKVIATIN